MSRSVAGGLAGDGVSESAASRLRRSPAAALASAAGWPRKLAMTKLRRLAAALTEDDTRLSDVLRLSLIEGLSIRAIARQLQLSRKTVRRLLGGGSRAQAADEHATRLAARRLRCG